MGMPKSRISICGIILALIFCLALYIRIVPPYDAVFGEFIRFGGNDPWYKLRLIESTLHHFPHAITFDAYTHYPHGTNVPFAPLYHQLIAFVIWIAGMGDPLNNLSQHTIGAIHAYFPTVLGSLVVFPVYFIAKEIFDDRRVGILSAVLIAILSGQFLSRSLLGFSDHHVAETLFSTLTIMFLIFALKTAKEQEISFKSISSGEWLTLKKTVVYTALTGIALGTYLLTWKGGLLLIFTIFIYMIIQYLVDYLRGKSTDYLCIIGVPVFVITLLMIPSAIRPGALEQLHILSLVLGIFVFLALSGLSVMMSRQKINRYYYPLVLITVGVVGLVAIGVLYPSLYAQFGIFFPTGGPATISETAPLLDRFDLVWLNFSSSFFIMFISLAMVGYAVFKEWKAEKTLLLVWSIVMILATLGQNRFAYYSAVNASILTGFFTWKMLDWGGFGKLYKDYKRRREKKGFSSKRFIRRNLKASHIMVVIIVFLVVFYTPIYDPLYGSYGTLDTAKHSGGPNDDWYYSLVWLRENTPDPGLDYDALYEAPSIGEDYAYPDSAYGVMSWWDYGHWIETIGRRIPNANPFQQGIGGPSQGDKPGACTFLTAQNEEEANAMLDELGTKYVIIDVETAVSKYHAVATWRYGNASMFFETYWIMTERGYYEPITFYYPAYYRSMCSRLYNFEGKEVVPQNSTWVISYTEETKIISFAQLFPTYEEAKAFMDNQNQTSPNYRIVGTHPFISPVPLEGLKNYELIHQSDSTVAPFEDGRRISYVEIFEYTTESIFSSPP